MRKRYDAVFKAKVAVEAIKDEKTTATKKRQKALDCHGRKRLAMTTEGKGGAPPVCHCEECFL